MCSDREFGETPCSTSELAHLFISFYCFASLGDDGSVTASFGLPPYAIPFCTDDFHLIA